MLSIEERLVIALKEAVIAVIKDFETSQVKKVD